MSFASDYVAQLERLASRARLPRLRALHLPPEPETGAERGEFCAVELEDGSLGLTFVLLGDTLDALRGLPPLAGGDALDLARRYAGAPGVERTLGFAVANAITRWLFDRAGFVPPPAADSIGLLDPQPGDEIGMIGLFGPLVPRLVERGARLTVVELRADLVGEREGWRVTTDARALQACSKVLATGTLLLNDTLDAMLGHCRGARRLALVGPSLGCLPDGLFARGVSSIGGSWIVEPAAFVQALRAGDARGAASRKFTLAAADYPGFESLLARL
ncbi:MAG: hypothetical protein KGN16_17210 [Burkholderiales bacterium]|nr:hypothetical protein [Burkholderiales bacterium]